ncbi:MAG: ABC transporter [Bacteroidetes bacterium]|nr:MAG: ABC transporter [Bacteroidota bacterium]PTM13268.1 MAG: ABC transporter [Bacteroidota bacterium]
MANKLLSSPGRRIRKAYWTALVVAFSYLGLYWRKKILGQRYYERRIGALHVRNAERVKTAVLELQGLFIKVGQLLSILTNFLPEAYQEPLDSLQDQVPARPLAEVEQRIVAEFGEGSATLFADFSAVPLAAASIGQAHRARLHDGTEVVVKIQHANIETVAEVDLRIINRLQQMISWWFDIKGMDHVYTQVRQMIEEELDFVAEAHAMQTIAATFADEPQFVIPAIHSRFCTQRVLTTTWFSGVKINKTQQLAAWGIDQEALAVRLLRIYCQMVLKDGFYHADPHPGNILVQEDGTLVLLDFGAVARLPVAMRASLSQLIEAAIKNDVATMVEASRKMGFVAPGREAERVAQQIIEAMRNFLRDEIKLEGLNFREIEVDPFNNSLFSLLKNIGFSGITATVQVPKEYVLLNRMATLLLGISSTLAPKLNPLDVVKPYLEEFVFNSRDDLFTLARHLLRDTATELIQLPGELKTFLTLARQGQLDIASVDTRQSGQLVYHGLRQLSFAILFCAASFFAYLLWRQGEPTLSRIGMGVALFFGIAFWRALRVGSKLRNS